MLWLNSGVDMSICDSCDLHTDDEEFVGDELLCPTCYEEAR